MLTGALNNAAVFSIRIIVEGLHKEHQQKHEIGEEEGEENQVIHHWA